MEKIEGISFDLTSHRMLTALINRLKSTGVCEVYGLPNMHKKKGEVRLAFHKPCPKRKKATGVFVQIRPAKIGAIIIKCRKLTEGPARMELTAGDTEKIFGLICIWREQRKEKLKAFEKVDPNQLGTLQGGRPESNRQKF